ncbi:N-acetylneuraminate synthase family protein [candidate division KSB1 bacterium]|nr:N-acetylneuraminate synthase family protein [candidate division KSB1 bacterium]
MNIDKDIKKYIVFSEDSLLHGLEKISKNKRQIVFGVSEAGVMEGVLSDGDFRRWVVDQKDFDIQISISRILKKDFVYCRETDSPETMEAHFFQGIAYIPILDDQNRLIAVATREDPKICVGDWTISDESPCFVIAEIGNNYNGGFEKAKDLVDAALWAGASCAKFQMRSMESLYRQAGFETNHREDLGTEYVLDLLNRFQLSDDDMFRIFDYCREKGILPLCTPYDMESLKKLEGYGMEAFKLASADLTNHEMIETMAQTRNPLFCSVGMSTDEEIVLAVDLLKKHGAQYVLMQCNSTYPPPFKDINLNYMRTLKRYGHCPVGYSGHERGISVAIAAVAMGAKVLEKHLTLDKGMEGNDHKISLLPEEFKAMVQGIREVEQAFGEEKTRRISQGELIVREGLAKSLVASMEIRRGDVITEEGISIRSPGKGLPPYRKKELIGKTAKRDFKEGDFFHLSDLQMDTVKPRDYKFEREWGIPVRFHDFKAIYEKSNMKLVEFHLSYKDLELSLDEYLTEIYPINFIVHAPELFAHDHILDLCTRDEDYRRRSIDELQKVIRKTLEVKRYFPKTEKPLIVVNAGGFTMNHHISPSERKQLYEFFVYSRHELDMNGVEIIPQTMPPFPWHFGGQRYHNLFVDPHEIAEICRENEMKICLDISHSKLACNFYKWSLREFIEIVAPFVVHIHLADAAGLDGEGLQIEEGELNFRNLMDDLNRWIPDASFIPEIWQGHKDRGAGFWKALDRLEKYEPDEPVLKRNMV